MKFTITAACLLFAFQQADSQEVSLKPYGIKSGIIEYKYTGNEAGNGTLYFDDYGNKSAINRKIKEETEVKE